ncbi:protein of unknown function UPF0016 [Thermodesulfatator indicus DSM 15286]|uniref:GDT1 family protein n=1 Tax=Thermodesulfatator indicus (strain DSM 15286 / JCM 11887 / CIR29812) TaxID=667014 RepID=F8AD12_THEID|nr:TMEM165/GDT1 family protein [Thermodesulfatator indicus]AEH45878.1 protein of unknown function UPF0016 [Thermodesulfatator indicus DSM 15286]
MKLFLTVFLTIFLAEIGDKTQLATLMFSAQNKSKFLIFLAASSALVAAAGLGVLAGAVIQNYLPLKYIRLAGGFLFIVLGILMLVGKF